MLELQHDAIGITLSFKGRTYFSHSQKEPSLYAGKGDADYVFSYGNFTITDELSEKIALSDFLVLSSDSDKAEIEFSRTGLYKIVISFAVEDERLVLSFKAEDSDINRIWLRFKADEEEHIYGGGEQFSELDLRGKRVPLWVSEGGVGRNKKSYITFQADVADDSGGDTFTTYYPQPTFVSSQNYFCHVEGSSYMIFNFLNDSYHELEMWQLPEKIILSSAKSAPELLTDLTSYLGRQPMLPEWAFDGMWLGLQGGTEIMFEKMKLAEENGIKLSSIWAQDWEGKRITAFGKQLMWDWIYDENMYPDLPKTIEKLKSQGIRYLGYINPFLALEGKLYQEASKNGYLVKNRDGDEYHVVITTFPAAVLDLTNPAACEWIKDVIKKNMIGIGLSGWMADFGEYLPTDAVLHSGDSAEFFHNRYPAEWARINREAIDETGKTGEVVFFTRAGYTGTSRYSTLMWNGDQFVDWSLDDSLASVIPASLSLGMSGFGLAHSDLGGYTSLFGVLRSKELFMRWAEHCAFTPVMRSHEGNRPDQNCQFDTDRETLILLAKMTDVHVHLKPYLMELVKENAEKGIPVMRHPYIHYENESRLHEFKYQYLLGRDLFVAPVYEKGVNIQSFYLPDDEWIHLWSGKEYTGGETSVYAPLGQIPVFYRKVSEFSELFASVRELAKSHKM